MGGGNYNDRLDNNESGIKFFVRRAADMYLRANTYHVDDEAFDSGSSDLWIVGLGVFFLSQVLINLGQNVVRLSHMRNQRFLWWIGLLFFLVGNLGSFSALNIAPQSTLEGLGAVQFLSNLIFAYRVLGEQILVRHAVSTSCIIAGNVLLVTFGSHTNRLVNAEDIVLLAKQPAFVAYSVGVYGIALLLQCTAFFQARIRHGKLEVGLQSSEEREVHPGIYAVISAMIGGNSVLLGKACISLIGQSIAHGGDNSRLTRMPGQPSEGDIITVVVVLWILHIGWWSWRLNLALKRFAALLVIPILQAIWIIETVISGGIFFEEFRGFSTERSCIFGFGLFMVLAGVLALCRQSNASQVRGSRRAGFDIWLNRPMSGKHCAANCDEGLELVRLDSVVIERNPQEGTGLLLSEDGEGGTTSLLQQTRDDDYDMGEIIKKNNNNNNNNGKKFGGKMNISSSSNSYREHGGNVPPPLICESPKNAGCGEMWDRPIGRCLGISAFLGGQASPLQSASSYGSNDLDISSICSDNNNNNSNNNNNNKGNKNEDNQEELLDEPPTPQQHQ